MLPREHGAYGQLLLPLVTTLAIGRPGRVAVALAAVAVCVFLAHEPLLVLLGARGLRAARDGRATAWRWVSLLGAAATGLGVLAVAGASPPTRLALLIPAAFVVVLAAAILAGRERTMAGEMCSALTLASTCLPVGIAADVPRIATLTCAVVYACAFVCATGCVHAIIAHGRQPPATATRSAAVAGAMFAIGALVWLATRGSLAPVAPWAAAPVCATGGVLAILPPRATRLRVVGWVLVGSSLAAATILVVAFR